MIAGGHAAAVDASFYLLVSFVLWTACAAALWRSLHLANPVQIPRLAARIMLTVATTALPITYLIQLAGHLGEAVNMRRTVGWMMAIALAWCAYTETNNRNQIQRATTTELADLLDDLRRLREGLK